MPQQLIYTSAPRGLAAGRSGHCTVARSASLREALALQLEKHSYYQHLSLSGGTERPIFSARVTDLRGSRFHVLSRIQDAGLDFTGRTNFIAHHLVFNPEEIRRFPTPPVILRDWPGWLASWADEPRVLENEDWSGLAALAGKANLPALTWLRVTGDAVNGYGLLEARAGASFRVDDQTGETVLALMAESLELLEVRDPRRDFRSAAWSHTFTTSMQEQDNPADFRWRCIHSDNPAAGRFAGPDCRALSAVRAAKWTGEETALARTGRQAPRFVIEPQDTRIVEGGAARLQVKAEGIPNPSYEWFAVDRAGQGQIIAGESGLELVLTNPPPGVSRYVARASNSAGEATTKVATLSVEPKLLIAPIRLAGAPGEPAKPGASHIRSEEEIENQRQRLQAEEAMEQLRKGRRRNKVILTLLAVAVIVASGVIFWKKPTSNKSDDSQHPPPLDKKDESSAKAPANLAEPSTTHTETNGSSPRIPLAENGPKLPTGWSSFVVGSVSNPHAECPSTKPPIRFDLTVASIGFVTNGDGILFVCKTNDGSEFIATIQKVDSATKIERCGIMIRESTSSLSPFLFIGASSQMIYLYFRDSQGRFGVSPLLERPGSRKGGAVFLKIRPMNNEFFATYSFGETNSSGGVIWIDSTDSLPSQRARFSGKTPLLVGFAVCSGSSSNTVTAHILDESTKVHPEGMK